MLYRPPDALRETLARRPDPLWIALALALGPAAVLGFGRFAYALLLPSMRADLGWSYAEAGAVNAANAAGYLAGALAAAAVAERIGAKRSYALSLIATGLVLLASALTRDYGVLLVLRVVAGALGAVVFVAGGSLTATATLAARRPRSALPLALYFSGPGLGIFLSGPLVSLSMGSHAFDWPSGWLALGAGALAAAALSAPALSFVVTHDAHARPATGFRIRPLAPTFVAYGLFGAGYIAYMTFIVAFLRANGFGTTETAVFWALLGASAVAAAFTWGRLLEALGRRSVAVVTGVALAGAVLPMIAQGPAAAFVSAALFGGSFLAVVTAVTQIGRKATPPEAWTRVIGALTVAFALGQCLGPVLAGVLADGPSGLRAGMLVSAALILAAALVSLAQRETAAHEPRP